MKITRFAVLVVALALASSSFQPRAQGQEHAAAPGVRASTPAVVDGAGAPLFAMPSRARGGSPLQRTPLTFVANEGQWDSPALFAARQGALTLSIERGGLAICTRGGDEDGDVVTAVRLEFEGANEDVVVDGLERAAGRRNYYIGNDPARWRTDVAAFRRVVYTSLYDGIDLQLRESAGLPEYDFVLLPGADLSQIRVRCDGVDSMCIDADGKLQIDTAAGPLHQSPPTTWYELASGERRLVECEFELVGERTYGFRVDGRDESLPLVVDPGLTWSTYYGGNGDDWMLGTCIAPSGHVIVAGSTTSTDLPGVTGSLSSARDGYIAVFDPSKPGPLQLDWATYVGGAADDLIFGLACDSTGELYATGGTRSTDFFTTAGAFDTSGGTALDAVVMELDRNTGVPAYSSYFGGGAADWGIDIAVSAPHVVTISGTTYSQALTFPITPGAFQPANGGGVDCFIARLQLNGGGPSDLVYSTFLGGVVTEGNVHNVPVPAEMTYQAMTLDAAGDVYVAGRTASPDFPVTANAYRSSQASAYDDAFVSHLHLQGNGAADLVYSTYLGGTRGEGAMAIAVDGSGVITVGGWTYSDDLPTTPGCFDPTYAGPVGSNNDGYIARLDPSRPASAQLLYLTYLGGQGWDPVLDLVADGTGGLIACGETGDSGSVSNAFPITCNAAQPAFAGESDAYVVRLLPNGNGADDLVYSTFVGGASFECFSHVRVAGSGSSLRIIATGVTLSANWPTFDAYQSTFGGGTRDTVVCEILIPPVPGPYCTAGTTTNGCVPSIAGIGNASASASSGFTLTVSNVEGQQNGLIFYGLSGQVANPWGLSTSFMCVKSPFERMPVQNSGGTLNACDGVLAIDWSQYVATHLGALGTPFVGGETVFAQGWFRDPPSPKTTSLSDALTFVVCP